MERFLILLFSLGLFNCSSDLKEQSSPKKEKTVLTQNSVPEADNLQNSLPEADKAIPKKVEEVDELKEIATSFHRWYINNVNNQKAKTPIEVRIVEGENGKCKIDYEPYFNQLKALETISEKFISQESKRVENCANNISKVSWAEYKAADAYEYDKYCDFLSYYYWIRSQEPLSGVDVDQMERNGDAWNVSLRFFDEFENKKSYLDHYHPIVKLEKEDDKWVITKISWKEN